MSAALSYAERCPDDLKVVGAALRDPNTTPWQHDRFFELLGERADGPRVTAMLREASADDREPSKYTALALLLYSGLVVIVGLIVWRRRR